MSYMKDLWIRMEQEKAEKAMESIQPECELRIQKGQRLKVKLPSPSSVIKAIMGAEAFYEFNQSSNETAPEPKKPRDPDQYLKEQRDANLREMFG